MMSLLNTSLSFAIAAISTTRRVIVDGVALLGLATELVIVVVVEALVAIEVVVAAAVVHVGPRISVVRVSATDVNVLVVGVDTVLREDVDLVLQQF